jgi:excisionase family DNA binding protein
MSADRDESFLTVAEVADRFKVNQQTVRNWIEQGRLPAVRVGRRVRIRRSDFDRILDGGSRRNSISASTAAPPRSAGPNAEAFWSGEPVGVAEPAPALPTGPHEPTDTRPSAPPGREEPEEPLSS